MAVYSYYNPNQNARIEEARQRLMGIMEQRQAFRDYEFRENQELQKQKAQALREQEEQALNIHHKRAAQGMATMGPWGALIGGVLGQGEEIAARMAHAKKYGKDKGKNWLERFGSALWDTNARLPAGEEFMMGAEAGAQMTKTGGKGGLFMGKDKPGAAGSATMNTMGSVAGLQGPAMPQPQFSASPGGASPVAQTSQFNYLSTPNQTPAQPDYFGAQPPSQYQPLPQEQGFGQTSQFAPYGGKSRHY